MRIDFKYNEKGYFILERELDLQSNCYHFYYGNRLDRITLRCISTYSPVKDWWEVLGYIEINDLNNFQKIDVSSYDIRTGINSFTSSQDIMNNIILITRRDYKIDSILNV